MSNMLPSPAELADLYPYGEPHPGAVADARTVFAAVSDLAFEDQDMATGEVVIPAGIVGDTYIATRYELERAQIGSMRRPVRPPEEVLVNHSRDYDGRAELPTGAYAPVSADKEGGVTEAEMQEMNRQGNEIAALTAYLEHQQAIRTHAEPRSLQPGEVTVIKEALLKAYRRTDNPADRQAIIEASTYFGYQEVLAALESDHQARQGERIFWGGYSRVATRVGALVSAITPISKLF